MAKWCFSLGIVSRLAHLVQRFGSSNTAVLQNLKRVEVIEDDEAEIIEAVRRMSDRYDFIVTRYGARSMPRNYSTLTSQQVVVLALRKHGKKPSRTCTGI